MWGGLFYGLAFFVLLTVAAWTSSISLLEPPTAYLVERTELTRRKAAMLGGAVVWVLGLLTLLGFNVWSEVKIAGRDLQGAIEFVASDIMLPLGGLLVSLYAGWVLDRRITRNELPQLSEGLYLAWRWTVRVIAPLLVLYILVSKFSG
jgi:neurotransmitter:Na+ symporter, NSS family